MLYYTTVTLAYICRSVLSTPTIPSGSTVPSRSSKVQTAISQTKKLGTCPNLPPPYPNPIRTKPSNIKKKKKKERKKKKNNHRSLLPTLVEKGGVMETFMSDFMGSMKRYKSGGGLLESPFSSDNVTINHSLQQSELHQTLPGEEKAVRAKQLAEMWRTQRSIKLLAQPRTAQPARGDQRAGVVGSRVARIAARCVEVVVRFCMCLLLNILCHANIQVSLIIYAVIRASFDQLCTTVWDIACFLDFF
jgi:hypothetical protein